ncbi:lipoprotein [Sphingomonas metalli]|uniref:Lipoprotein n=2 Tax=Sphingomonas metalli TaxID=1779358 RepID=A0A916T425_9SPHN|nr:lipoprotein [Sphingomonas metalli]
MMLRALLLLALCLLAQPARAACTLASAVTNDFGSRTSYDVRTATGGSQALPTQLSCNGSILGVFSADYMKATATSTNAFRLRSASGDTIGYRLSADSAGSYAFTQGGTINYMDSAFVSLLGILNPGYIVPPMYAALSELPNLPAGTYTDTVTMNWSWAVCRLLGVGGICVLQETGSGTTTITVTLTVSRDCRISAPAIAFGTAPLASQFASVTQAVAVDCTKGTAYTIAFTAGANSATARPWRQMKSGTNLLRYNIYRPDGVTIWDESNPLAAAQPGTGATTPAQMQTYVAKVDPGQTTPAAGSYTDTVSVVIGF